MPQLPAWLTLEHGLITAYLATLLTLAMYGFHRSLLLFMYYKHRGNEPVEKAQFADDAMPFVTIQLPLFNEMYVAPRLLEAVAQIRYPKDRFEIQVLDDSTDETQAMCKAKVEELRALGLDIEYLHRTDRTGR